MHAQGVVGRIGFRYQRDRLGPCQRGAFGVGEERGFLPCGQAIEALLGLAGGAGLAAVQVTTIGAAVDLLDAQLDQGLQLFVNGCDVLFRGDQRRKRIPVDGGIGRDGPFSLLRPFHIIILSLLFPRLILTAAQVLAQCLGKAQFGFIGFAVGFCGHGEKIQEFGERLNVILSSCPVPVRVEGLPRIGCGAREIYPIASNSSIMPEITDKP